MYTQRSMSVGARKNVTVAQVRKAHDCQSPLACGNRATRWNGRQRMYLCEHCQEVLDEMQTGITVIRD